MKEIKGDLDLSVKDSFVSQFVNKNSRFKADNVKVNVDGSIDITNPVIEVVEEASSVVGVRDSVVKDKGASVAVESVKASSRVSDKNVDREQYSWRGWLVPFGILIGIGWLVWRRYK
ncbi:hypothetical protein [Myroides odoratimimus]|uniref:hypothetical protein n=1 Tax=Myroides odoratimimus TaxID=76832 RepID=UPI002576F740|nr:hypothetical protein [Myroides odoratimimus]